MIVHSYESTKRSAACIEYIGEIKAASELDKVILLPIPTTRDKSTILNTNIYINSVLDEIFGKTLICGYAIPDDFKRDAASQGCLILDLSEDEPFLCENAEITAVCTLGIILSSTQKAPRDNRIGIVGYGRIGARLSRMLLQIGARVRVYTTRESARDELCGYGVDSTTDKSSDISELDILINTAPAKIFSRDEIPRTVRIIDLASGENFPDFEDVERYPSIPAKMFPVSAGRAWGRAIERFLISQ